MPLGNIIMIDANMNKKRFKKNVATKTGDSKPIGTDGGGSAKTLGVSQQPGNPIMDYGIIRHLYCDIIFTINSISSFWDD